jgi:hypothetical protein
MPGGPLPQLDHLIYLGTLSLDKIIHYFAGLCINLSTCHEEVHSEPFDLGAGQYASHSFRCHLITNAYNHLWQAYGMNQSFLKVSIFRNLMFNRTIHLYSSHCPKGEQDHATCGKEKAVMSR